MVQSVLFMRSINNNLEVSKAEMINSIGSLTGSSNHLYTKNLQVCSLVPLI